MLLLSPVKLCVLLLPQEAEKEYIYILVLFTSCASQGPVEKQNQYDIHIRKKFIEEKDIQLWKLRSPIISTL